MSKDIFIFVGPPGSGKGSLSRLCVKRLNWKQISTGNLCREHVINKTEIGNKIDFLIKSGKLISNEIIIDIVNQYLIREFNSNSSVIILDGFPRTTDQITALNQFLDKYRDIYNINVNIIKMDIKPEIVANRLLNRFICSNNSCQAIYSNLDNTIQTCKECNSRLVRRVDDEIDIIKTRLKDYYETEAAIFERYIELNYPYFELDAEMPLELVYKQFKDKFQEQLKEQKEQLAY